MKKLLLSILFFIFLNFAYGQNGIVSYKFIPISDEKIDSLIQKMPVQYQMAAKPLAEKMIKSSGKYDYILKFNDKMSVFKQESNLDDMTFVENKELSFGFYGTKVFYFDFNNKKKYRFLVNFGEAYLINSAIENDWKITSEHKKIGNYMAYKATRKGKDNFETVAWFTPEIPVYIGPADFGGLPGLILEVNVHNRGVFKVKKINFIKKEINIKLPSGIKEVTQKEYKEIMQKVKDRIKKYY